jgi:hypothetical protein
MAGELITEIAIERLRTQSGSVTVRPRPSGPRVTLPV